MTPRPPRSPLFPYTTLFRSISRTLYQGRDRAPARSFLHAIGLKAEDIDKPFVGLSNVWTETMPCNFGLRELAAPIKAGIRAARSEERRVGKEWRSGGSAWEW